MLYSSHFNYIDTARVLTRYIHYTCIYRSGVYYETLDFPKVAAIVILNGWLLKGHLTDCIRFYLTVATVYYFDDVVAK